VKKIALAVLLAFALAPAASMAQVIVRIGPPHNVYERRGPRPDRGAVWVNGYHRYDNGHYAWTQGRWDHPPRARQHWVRNRWEHRRGGWVMIDGHWR
jgi:opacity protein-like surface antigen